MPEGPYQFSSEVFNVGQHVCLSQLFEVFYDRFGKRYKYRAQDPITLPNHSEPEPDFVIATRKAYTRQIGHPGPEDVHLLIELSARTLRYDRGDKLRAYALADIGEYWIINLEHRQVEVHLQPNEAVGDYALTTIYRSGQTFESPFGGAYTVDELLPPTLPDAPAPA